MFFIIPNVLFLFLREVVVIRLTKIGFFGTFFLSKSWYILSRSFRTPIYLYLEDIYNFFLTNGRRDFGSYGYWKRKTQKAF